jgi:hypothetical protein
MTVPTITHMFVGRWANSDFSVATSHTIFIAFYKYATLREF